MPSLKYNTHRRFCYVQFRSPSSAYEATQLNDSSVGGNLRLVAKISDPTKREARTGPVHEGREIHVSNIDWKATEDDLNELFSAYGKVESVRIPTKVGGGSKGFGFVVFSSKVCLRTHAGGLMNAVMLITE
jgi:RNA recognition motif-containing protein